MSTIKVRFQQDLAEVTWKDLRIHLQRDAIIIVADELDIIAVAVALAEDAKEQVATWIAAGQLLKPTVEQLDGWENELDKPFRVLIVQPFILIQMVKHA